MKALATLDGSASSESILEQITKIATLPIDDVLLFSVVESPGNGVRMRGPLRSVIGVSAAQGSSPQVLHPKPSGYVENKGQAIDRQLAEREDYLKDLIKRLPVGPMYRVATAVHEDPACAIVERALVEEPDVIIMTTHGRTGLVHILFGDTAEEVVRSGVAPVLLVHPRAVRDARAAARG